MPIPSKGEPIERQSAKEKIYHTLSEWIVTGVLKPDEKIFDTEIADFFQ